MNTCSSYIESEKKCEHPDGPKGIVVCNGMGCKITSMEYIKQIKAMEEENNVPKYKRMTPENAFKELLSY